ncbi:MAG: hypothetical protein ACLFV4_09835 [Candidatus Hydrogenedentota bacterium]
MLFIGDFLGRLTEVIRDQVMVLPPDSLTAQIYNVVNILLQLYALFLNTMANGGSPA